MIEIFQAQTPEHINEGKKLFREYAISLGCSPCFKNMEKELDKLPGEYAPPDGRLLLARYDSSIAGTVALRKISEVICEMRRLYVRPEFRGKKIGKNLVRSLIEDARRIGYGFMRLYTLPSMKEAIGLYQSLGFQKIDPYGETIIDDALYRELKLK